MSVSIPAAAKMRKNLFTADSHVIAEAKIHFKEQCAEAPNLHADHIRKLTDGEMFYIVKNGVRFTGMPGWDLEDATIGLVSLIRQFAKETPAAKPWANLNR